MHGKTLKYAESFQQWGAGEDIWSLEEGIDRGVDESCSMRSVIICTHPEGSLW